MRLAAPIALALAACVYAWNSPGQRAAKPPTPTIGAAFFPPVRPSPDKAPVRRVARLAEPLALPAPGPSPEAVAAAWGRLRAPLSLDHEADRAAAMDAITAEALAALDVPADVVDAVLAIEERYEAERPPAPDDPADFAAFVARLRVATDEREQAERAALGSALYDRLTAERWERYSAVRKAFE